MVIDYSYSKQLFNIRTSAGIQNEISRIYFICDFENPVQYVQKLKAAFWTRAQMDSVIRYNYYIDNMHSDDVIGLPQWQ